MKLTHEDINELVKIIDNSEFDEIHVDVDDLSVDLRRTGSGDWVQSVTPLREANIINKDTLADGGAEASVDQEIIVDGGVPVRTPLIGTFYRAPSPGAEPFIKEGDSVQEDTVIGIVETMKLMNSIVAGTQGKVIKIFRKDGDFVEKDEVLIIVEKN